ncbi:hypothetical protein [Rubritalea tangerina]|uniref:hypothetical protein n=1 Tax=Rubritalea tangerina TaxID=430798 RepID=UPI003607EEB3
MGACYRITNWYLVGGVVVLFHLSTQNRGMEGGYVLILCMLISTIRPFRCIQWYYLS